MNSEPGRPTFGTGLVILFIAQSLSAIMGIYTEETYKAYGPHWRENLFYSHLLSLPLFLPFLSSLIKQSERLATSAPLGWSKDSSSLLPQIGHHGQEFVGGVHVPIQLAYLVVNVLTQYACIRGVNLLAAASSALTVTIVLNIRKLVSLLLSIWLFGNRLAPGTLVGAIVVFGAGALYSLGARPRQQSSTVGNDKMIKKQN
jgi:solute carrier family 35 (UDP-xylose/UDP-N-acetylglucosamine transporter), member B4